MAKKITIKDIAKEAGVSYQVVSAILSGKGDTIRFSNATKEKVEAVAHKLNYRPSILARSFQANRSFLIGIMGSYGNSFIHSGLVRGAQEFLFRKGLSPIFFSHRSHEEEMSNLNHLLERQVEGIIVDTYGDFTPEKLKRYRTVVDMGIPVLSLFGETTEFPNLRQDMFQVGYLATKHLIEVGRKHIALFTHDRYQMNADAKEQYRGYIQAVKEANYKPTILTLNSKQYRGSENMLSWYNCAIEMAEDILTDDSFDGIVCYEVSFCYALIVKANALGIKIPETKALIGYHDWDICEIAQPSISSIKVAPYDLGHVAAEMILKFKDGVIPKSQLVAPRLTIRGSSSS